MTHHVKLSYAEVLLAASVGIRRHWEAIRQGRSDSYGRTGDDGWSIHIEGACGELAAAKALGVYWEPTINTFKTGGDVGRFCVRTRSRRDYQMLIRNSDADDKIFILVRGMAPDFEVVGWITGSDAKRRDWIQTHGGRPPAYFPPDCELRPIEDLRSDMGVIS